MKKFLAIMLVALVAPAMASVNVTTDNTTAGQLTITLTADGTETTEIVGVALTVDSATAIEGMAVDSFFDVFIDTAHDVGAGYTPGPTSGSGIAAQGAAGALSFPQSSFSISIAGLDDDGIGEGTEEAPLTCTIVLECAAGSADVDICLDTLRGGVVSYAGAETVTGLCAENIVIAPAFDECQMYNLSKVINGLTDNVLNAGDVTIWVNYVNANRVSPTIFAVVPTNPNYDARYNFDAIATINSTDIIQMVNYINANRVSPTIFARLCQ